MPAREVATLQERQHAAELCLPQRIEHLQRRSADAGRDHPTDLRSGSQLRRRPAGAGGCCLFRLDRSIGRLTIDLCAFDSLAVFVDF